jgi:hypothetical protein
VEEHSAALQAFVMIQLTYLQDTDTMLGFSLPLYFLVGAEICLAALLCIPLPLSRPAIFIVKLSKGNVRLDHSKYHFPNVYGSLLIERMHQSGGLLPCFVSASDHQPHSAAACSGLCFVVLQVGRSIIGTIALFLLVLMVSPIYDMYTLHQQKHHSLGSGAAENMMSQERRCVLCMIFAICTLLKIRKGTLSCLWRAVTSNAKPASALLA